jgi:hypothetical protein
MKELAFLLPIDLEIRSELHNDITWAIAAEELHKMDKFLAPQDKVDCIVRCAKVIFKSLSMASARSAEQKRKEKQERGNKSNNESEDTGDASSPPALAGADDFLPIFIWVVLQSRAAGLYSTCEYVQAFYNPLNLMSKGGYCLVNLQSALEFIMNIDAQTLHMDSALFAQKCAECSGGPQIQTGPFPQQPESMTAAIEKSIFKEKEEVPIPDAKVDLI